MQTFTLDKNAVISRALQSSPGTKAPDKQENRGWAGASALQGVDKNSEEAQLVGEADEKVIAAWVERDAVRLLRELPHQLQALQWGQCSHGHKRRAVQP